MIAVKDIKAETPWWMAQAKGSPLQEGQDFFGAIFATAQQQQFEYRVTEAKSHTHEQRSIEKAESQHKPRSRKNEEIEDRANELQPADREGYDVSQDDAVAKKRPSAFENTSDSKDSIDSSLPSNENDESAKEPLKTDLVGMAVSLLSPSGADTQTNVAASKRGGDCSDAATGQGQVENAASGGSNSSVLGKMSGDMTENKNAANAEQGLKLLVGDESGSDSQEAGSKSGQNKVSASSSLASAKELQKKSAQEELKIMAQEDADAASTSLQKPASGAGPGHNTMLGMEIPGMVMESPNASLGGRQSGRQSSFRSDTMMVHGLKPQGADDKMASQGILAERSGETGEVVPQKNIEEIIKSAKSAIGQGSSRIQIRLDPPELGSLSIEIRQNSEGLQLQLYTSTAKAQQLLQEHSSQLKSALEAQGLPTTQIDIQLRLPTPDGQSGDYRGDTGAQPQPHDFHQSARQGFTSDQGQSWAGQGWQEEMAAMNDLKDASAGWQEIAFARLDVKG